MAEQYRRWSPYNYTMNNPIRFIDPDGMAADTTLLEMVDVYASKAWNYLTSYSFIKSSSDFVSGGQTSQMEHSLELYRTKGYKEYIYDQIGAAHRDNMYSMMSGGYQARSSRAKIRFGKKVPALRAAYVAGLSSLASKMRAAGKSSEEIAKVLHGLRRELGVKYKSLTPDNLLQQIYQRNIQKYGDKLGPSIEYLRNVKGKSWDDIIESATRTGGKDLGL